MALRTSVGTSYWGGFCDHERKARGERFIRFRMNADHSTVYGLCHVARLKADSRAMKTAQLQTMNSLLHSFQSLPPPGPNSRRLLYTAAAVPTMCLGVGMLQLISLLVEYRLHHRDAPEPISPACGKVVATATTTAIGDSYPRGRDTGTNAGFSRAGAVGSCWESLTARVRHGGRHNTSAGGTDSAKQQRKPIRLLVVGDSLAVGVGSGSASPVLPESIARALSSALGGRAIHWTCIGTSGASAGRIVRDIETYHEDDNETDASKPVGRDVVRKILPWTRERIWAWLEAGDGEEDSSDQSNSIEHVHVRAKVKFMSWLRRRLENIDWLQQREKDLWKHWRARRNDGLVYDNNLSDAKKEYDVAVVLTGLNDVKDATLPFLASDSQEEMEMRRHEQKCTESYEGQLKNILRTLQERMNLNHQNFESNPNMSTDPDPHHIETTATETCREPRPMIVLPGLPASIVPVFQWIPLKWFLVPLLRGVDNQKRALSNKYPNSVLFVDSPDLGRVEQYEASMGNIHSKPQNESVLVLIQDICPKARQRAQRAMDKYYQLKDKIGLQDQTESETEKQYEQAYHQHGASSRPMTLSQRIGSKLFSLDGLHPNDEGYDFYGRHIANAIVAEWEDTK